MEVCGDLLGTERKELVCVVQWECGIPVKQDRVWERYWCAAYCLVPVKRTGVRRSVGCGEPKGGVRRTVWFRKARLCGRKRCASYCPESSTV